MLPRSQQAARHGAKTGGATKGRYEKNSRMTEQNQSGFAARMFARGYSGLVSVVPPNAQLSPTSKLPKDQLGKIPGQKRKDGRWSGYAWQRHVATMDDARRWDTSGANIGIRADHTPAVDIDCVDAELAAIIQAVAFETLGAAPVRVGRAPKRILMYRAAEPFGRMRLWIDDRKHLVEILGSGQQYVLAGTHPVTGNAYEWDTPPDAFAPSDLPPITRETAAAFLGELTARLETLSVGKVEREGDGRPVSRSEFEQAALLAPSLDVLAEAVRQIPNTNELFPSRSDYLKMAYAIRAAAGEPQSADAHDLFAEWAAKWEGNGAFAGNDPVVVAEDWARVRGPYSVGWPWLAEMARGNGFSDAQLDFNAIEGAVATSGAPPFVDRLNARYAKVRAVANAVLHTPEQGAVDYMPQAHWRDMLANELIELPGKNGSRSVPASKLWMEHPKRRTFDRIVFDPTRAPLCGIPSTNGGGVADFNLWPGFAVTPSSEGSCARFLAHLREMVCCGNALAFDWVEMWLAAIMQHPERLSGTALVLRGVQGAGKTIVGEIVGAILGPRLYTVVSGTEELTGRFNAHQEGRLLVQVEEAFFAGDPRIVGKIKNMITAPVVRIERKHVDAFTINNYARIIITSNEGWVIPAGEGERRFMVLDVSPLKAKDRDYFSALHKEVFQEGGLARLLHHLKHDVTVDWDVISRPLGTDALRDQQVQSLDPAKRWLLELLNDATLPGDLKGEGKAWAEEVRQSYERYMKDKGVGRRASSEALGRMLSEYGVEKKDRRDSGQKRKCYEFPPLAEIRASFAASFATAPEWDEADGWQALDSLVGATA